MVDSNPPEIPEARPPIRKEVTANLRWHVDKLLSEGPISKSDIGDLGFIEMITVKYRLGNKGELTLRKRRMSEYAESAPYIYDITIGEVDEYGEVDRYGNDIMLEKSYSIGENGEIGKRVYGDAYRAGIEELRKHLNKPEEEFIEAIREVDIKYGLEGITGEYSAATEEEVKDLTQKLSALKPQDRIIEDKLP